MKRFAFLLSLLCLFTTLSPGATKPKVADAYGKLPLSFEANQGQSGAQVKFLSRGSGYTLFLTSSEAVLLLQKGAPSGGVKQRGRARIEEPVKSQNLNRGNDGRTKSDVLRIRLVGANPAPQLAGLDDLPGKANYFIGNDPKKWRMDVATYGKVKCHAVYPGVDLVYYGNQRQLEHDFIVAPGADPRVISLRLEGAKKLSLDSHGDLVLKTQNGEVRFQKPTVYQEVDGARQEIAGGYKLEGEGHVGFAVADYDRTKPLVIDPTLLYSTYLGGSGDDGGAAITVDSAGSAYVSGTTFSTNFPTTTGAFQTAYAGGYDVFVTKLNPAGSGLVYSTYLGGSIGSMMGWPDGSDVASARHGIAVDSAGSAYVTGFTQSTDFPTTTGAYKTTLIVGWRGHQDSFVTKLNAAGSGLVYSTYLIGYDGSNDQGTGIGVDSAGSAYVISVSGGATFVTKLNAAGSGLVYSAELIGNSFTFSTGIAVDSVGSAYVTGYTRSTDLATPGAFQTAYAGGYDVFITKLNAAGSGPVYSTYLGGSGEDYSGDIVVDSAGSAYVTGYTSSTNFPTTTGAFQTACAGAHNYCNFETFVTKLNADGSGLVYSTYLGGTGQDFVAGIAVDSAGNAWVTGNNNSTDFPTTSGALQTAPGGGFLTKLSAAGSGLVYSTYLDGIGNSIAVDSAGSAYVTGTTNSTNFPTTTGAFQTANAGGYDAFVTKITDIVLNASVQQPINPDGTSVFKASQGVIRVRFTLTLNGAATCQLPPATISLTRTSGGTIGPIDESVYETAADTGSDFRISGCQYGYNIAASSLGTGTYRVDISINGGGVGSGIFGLK